MMEKTETLSDKIFYLPTDADTSTEGAILTEDVKSSVQKILAKIEHYFDNSELYDYKKHRIALKEIIKQEIGDELLK